MCLCMKMSASIGSKCDFWLFLFLMIKNVTSLGNHLCKRTCSPTSIVFHFVVNEIMERDFEKNWYEERRSKLVKFFLHNQTTRFFTLSLKFMLKRYLIRDKNPKSELLFNLSVPQLPEKQGALTFLRFWKKYVELRKISNVFTFYLNICKHKCFPLSNIFSLAKALATVGLIVENVEYYQN